MTSLKLEKFKKESEIVLESAKLAIHKTLGHAWNKREDTLEIQVPTVSESEPVTKRSIMSQLGNVYDPLGIISPTMAEGKHMYNPAKKSGDGMPRFRQI